MKSEIEPGEVVDLPPPKPECPYWSDGRHCYTAIQSAVQSGDKRVIEQWLTQAKACACGSKVSPV